MATEQQARERRVDLQLRAWLRGQAFVCACLGAMYAIGLLACGVPFAIPLAIFGGIALILAAIGALAPYFFFAQFFLDLASAAA